VAGIVFLLIGRWLNVRSAVRLNARAHEAKREVRRKQNL